jgi:hypothetical protein
MATDTTVLKNIYKLPFKQAVIFSIPPLSIFFKEKWKKGKEIQQKAYMAKVK